MSVSQDNKTWKYIPVVNEDDPLIIDKPKENKVFVIILTLFAALGGFLFGYDTGVVSGAMLKIKASFSLTSIWVELIVSVTIASAAVSAVVAGFLCDLIGRRWTLIIASLVFTGGAVIVSTSLHSWMLLIGRLVLGVGIGFAATTVPMYIAESAPARMRGKLVVVNVVFITGGQFIATIVDGIFSYLPTNVGWRFMMGLAGIPSLLMFVGFLFMPESPRWLVFKGKEEKARKVLLKIRHPDKVSSELQSIVEDYEEYIKTKMGCSEFVKRFLTTKSVLLALVVGCGLQLFQQLGGINTVMYYGASILQMAGFSDEDSIWLATIPGGTNFFFTFLGLVLVDRLGRRKLLIGSVCGVIFSILLLSGTFYIMDQSSPPSRPYDADKCAFYHCGVCVGNSECGFCADLDPTTHSSFNGTCNPLKQLKNGSYISMHERVDGSCLVFGEARNSSEEINLQRKWYPNTCPNNKYALLAIVSLFLYIATFAPGFGPLPWIISSEIYPTWARSTAISLATMVNWIFNLVVSMTFLTMADALGQPVTFLVYAGLTFTGLLFIVFFVPETKGWSLEEVESLFQRPYFLSWCKKR